MMTVSVLSSSFAKIAQPYKLKMFRANSALLLLKMCCTVCMEELMMIHKCCFPVRYALARMENHVVIGYEDELLLPTTAHERLRPSIASTSLDVPDEFPGSLQRTSSRNSKLVQTARQGQNMKENQNEQTDFGAAPSDDSTFFSSAFVEKQEPRREEAAVVPSSTGERPATATVAPGSALQEKEEQQKTRSSSPAPSATVPLPTTPSHSAPAKSSGTQSQGAAAVQSAGGGAAAASSSSFAAKTKTSKPLAEQHQASSPTPVEVIDNIGQEKDDSMLHTTGATGSSASSTSGAAASSSSSSTDDASASSSSARKGKDEKPPDHVETGLATATTSPTSGIPDLITMCITFLVFATLTLIPFVACLWWVALVFLAHEQENERLFSLLRLHRGRQRGSGGERRGGTRTGGSQIGSVKGEEDLTMAEFLADENDASNDEESSMTPNNYGLASPSLSPQSPVVPRTQLPFRSEAFALSPGRKLSYNSSYSPTKESVAHLPIV
ncbi:unnamed protein product [Amoebophrya sp. A120]|nr:unnamed protein product [Amoebophrya sp. A120]|eukprot:GSA120T00020097001.1